MGAEDTASGDGSRNEPTLGIVCSRADSASVNVAERLLDLTDWEAVEDDSRPDGEGGGTVYRTPGAVMRSFEELHVSLDGVDRVFDADLDLLVFASRHAGDTGPLLSAHHTGNFGSADYGGAEGAFARAAPGAHKHVIETFGEVAPPGYEIATECTHHGPTDVETPSLFCELGSEDAQWEDPAGAESLARAILSLRGIEPTGDRTLVGFGGGHYANRFLRISRETDWAVGHVGAAWAIEEMGAPARSEGVLRRAMERSGTEYAVVDGREPAIESALRESGYRVVSETWVRESSGVALALVGALEERLTPIEEGLRFGEEATLYDSGEPNADADDLFAENSEVVSLPASLLAEAQGIDREAVRTAVVARTLAFETSEGGTVVSGRVALARPEARSELIDALVGVLATKYDEIEREEDEEDEENEENEENGVIVVRESAFDPERARHFGVEEGPAFGRLAAGETVEVDGREISPEDVHAERERRFPLVS